MSSIYVTWVCSVDISISQHRLTHFVVLKGRCRGVIGLSSAACQLTENTSTFVKTLFIQKPLPVM